MSRPDIPPEVSRSDSSDVLESFLDAVCGGNAAMRQEMRSLLARFDGGLSTPPANPSAVPQGEPKTVDVASPREQGDSSSGLELDAQIGDLLDDKYKIREKLGQGGMGAVFVADQITPVERRVAVKVIKAGMDSANVVARFAQERQALALMDHPNIARIFDGGLTRLGRPYFVMELVRGLPLTRFCDQEKLSVRQRVELFLPICRAVQHAHQKGIIHRDLKPLNILVALQDGKPTPKVIDFGVAKALHPGLTDESVYTAQNTVVGTLEYMAPEQATLTSLDVDTRADIYSLGVVLYELLCGCLPLARGQELRGNLLEQVRAIREVEPQRPSTRVSTAKEGDKIAERREIDRPRLQRSLKGDLDWVAMKCLEKERDRRYQTANGLAADLERYLRDEPVLAAPPSRSYRVRKFLRRHSGKAIAAALALVMLVVASVATTVGWVRAARAEQQAKDEAAIHKALIGFIQHDMFDSIDPAERARLGLPRDVDASLPMRALLDPVSRRVKDGRLADQPLVEAALRLTLAKAYLALGLNDEALGHATQADQLRLTHLGPDHPYRLDTLEMLGRVQLSADQFQNAARTFALALQGRRRQQGGDDLNAFKSRYHLAIIERRLGRGANSEELLRALLEDERRTLGQGHEETLRAQRALGEALLGQSRFHDAEPLLSDALAAGEATYGPEHPTALGTLNSLAVLHSRKGGQVEAEKLFRSLLQRAGKVYAADHPMLAVYKNNLASCLIRQKQLQPALALLREVRPTFERVGPTHQLTLVMKSNLASVLTSLGNYDEAAALYESLLPLFLDTFSGNHNNTRNLMRGMADLQAKQGDRGKAVATLTKLLQFQRDQKPVDTKAVAATTRAITTHLRQLAALDRAEALLKEVIAELPMDSAERQQLQTLHGELRGKK